MGSLFFLSISPPISRVVQAGGNGEQSGLPFVMGIGAANPQLPTDGLPRNARSAEPTHGKIVIAAINGDYTVKRLHRKADGTRLMPANDAYPPIDISGNVDFHIAGVVVKILRNL